MSTITKTLTNLAFGCCLISGGAQAASIQSLTIEEIGVASGGLGTSALAGGGGVGDWLASSATIPSPAYFVSDGTDGALIMGQTQANGAFSSGFNWNGNHFELNTLGVCAEWLYYQWLDVTQPIWIDR